MAVPRIQVDIRGAERIRGALGKSQANLFDQRPLWKRADERITDLAETQFRTRGGLTGGWPGLASSTREAALERGESTRLMMRTGTLRRALTNPRDDAAIREVRRGLFRRGVDPQGDAFYALFHEQGARDDLPKREVLVWRDRDTRWLLGEAGEQLTEPFD